MLCKASAIRGRQARRPGPARPQGPVFLKPSSSIRTTTTAFGVKRFSTAAQVEKKAAKPPASPVALSGIVQGQTGAWETVIGLEIHAQITANTKLFSDAPTSFAKAPNTQVALVDAALPGSLPVVNKFCIDQAIKTGLAINGRVNQWSAFDRKHYFYADLPTGYQITQYYAPIVTGGEVVLNLPDHSIKKVKIERIQLETDSGKSLHEEHPMNSFVDLNRAGSGLMEIVSEPDMRSAVEAGQFVKKIQFLLKHIGACDGNMEEGSLRCDANVSVRKVGSTESGVRCEVKNLNSIRSIMRAIEYEAERHVKALEAGQKIGRETRFFDPVKRVTILGRKKEEETDYRYFPEPDLPPLVLEDGQVGRISAQLPELPDAIQARLQSQYKLPSYEAEIIATNYGAPAYFEETAKGRNGLEAAKWMINEIFGYLNEKSIDIPQSAVSSRQLGQIMDLIANDKITARIGKEIIELMFEKGETRDPEIVIKERGLYTESNTATLEAMCNEIFQNHPDEVAKYRSGKKGRMKFFVGEVMKRTQGRAPGPTVTSIFEKLLDAN